LTDEVCCVDQHDAYTKYTHLGIGKNRWFSGGAWNQMVSYRNILSRSYR
jgi:hypothetical protein